MLRFTAIGARARVAAGLALLVTALGFGSSCDDPQSPTPQTPTAFDARWEGSTLQFTLDAGANGAGLTLVATALGFDPVTEELRADVALHNHGHRATVGPTAVIVSGFVPATVVPVGAVCDARPAGGCAFDHHGTYGDDGVLSPGETSAPVVWRLHVPGGQSFAFRARLAAPEQGAGTIAGIVFFDANGDGVRDAGELGVADASVRLRFGARSDTRRTDGNGAYAFHVSAAGLYEVGIEPRDGWRATTAPTLQVAVLQLADGSLSSFVHGDFGVVRGAGGPVVTIVGSAYADLDRDGQRDEGEPGLAGVKVEGRVCARAVATLGDDDDADEFETRTDLQGHYALALPDCGGPLQIRGGSVDGYDRTTPRTVVLASGAELRADFGYAIEDASSRFEVSGVVFRDDNGDGVRDPNEPPLAGVLVTVDGIGCDSPVLASDRTDERGRYELEGEDVACPLPWLVQREALAGGTDTTPASVRLEHPPLGGREFRVDFGVRLPPPPAMRSRTGGGTKEVISAKP